MKHYAVIAACGAALAGLAPAFGADADPLAAGAALESDAMAAVSGARPGAGDPQAPADIDEIAAFGISATFAPGPGGGPSAGSALVLGNGNAVASAVLSQTLPRAAAEPSGL